MSLDLGYYYSMQPLGSAAMSNHCFSSNEYLLLADKLQDLYPKHIYCHSLS